MLETHAQTTVLMLHVLNPLCAIRIHRTAELCSNKSDSLYW